MPGMSDEEHEVEGVLLARVRKIIMVITRCEYEMHQPPAQREILKFKDELTRALIAYERMMSVRTYDQDRLWG